MTTPRGQDVVGLFLTQLKNKQEDVRNTGARELRIYLDNKSQEMSAETFSKFFADVGKRIGELVNSNDVNEKLGGVRAINEVQYTTLQLCDCLISILRLFLLLILKIFF
jgi:hypothetical protein